VERQILGRLALVVEESDRSHARHDVRPEDHCPRGTQTTHDRRVTRRSFVGLVRGQTERKEERQAFDGDVLLDGDRNAVQRTEGVTAAYGVVSARCLLTRAARIEGAEAVQDGIQLLGASEEVLGHFERGHLARRDELA
jgi:hypothetical protein